MSLKKFFLFSILGILVNLSPQAIAGKIEPGSEEEGGTCAIQLKAESMPSQQLADLEQSLQNQKECLESAQLNLQQQLFGLQINIAFIKKTPAYLPINVLKNRLDNILSRKAKINSDPDHYRFAWQLDEAVSDLVSKIAALEKIQIGDLLLEIDHVNKSYAEQIAKFNATITELTQEIAALNQKISSAV